MKILITGINGFVGKHLREILTQLSYQVWGVDYISQSEEVFSVDICNKLQMEEIVNRIKPDCVYHLAAASFVDDQNVDAIYDVNVKGTLNVLASCCTLDKLPRFIFISSSQVYGNVPDELQPIVEDMPLNPVNHYGASKAIGEMLVKLYSTEYGLEYVIFRPFNHTGVGQNEIFVIPKIIKAFKENLRCIELGNIDVERDFCDVRDVVRAYALALEHWKPCAIYNVASEKSYSIKQVISMVKAITGSEVEICQNDALYRKNEIRKAVGSYAKINRELGWQPTIQLYDTLKDMLRATEGDRL